MASKNYRTVCKVIDNDGRPTEGIAIRAFDQDPKSANDALGEPTVTDAGGVAIFRFTSADFTEHPGEKGPDIFFELRRGEVKLGYKFVGVKNDKGVIRDFKPQSAPIVIRLLDGNEEGEVVYHVDGRVAGSAGTAGADLRVAIIDKAVGGDVTVGTAETDADGRYEVFFTGETLAAC